MTTPQLYTPAQQQVHERLRAIGPHPAWQLAAPPVLDSDLVAVPVSMSADGTVQPLQFHGEPTWTAPKLVTVYLGNYWGDKATHDRFLYEMMEFGYLSKLRPFGVGAGKWYGSFQGPTPGREMYDSEVQKLLGDWLATSPAGVLLGDPQTLYMCMMPDGITVKFDGTSEANCTSFCGYHSSFSHPSAGPLVYSTQFSPRCSGCNQGTSDQDYRAAVQAVCSHEASETFTDAHGRGWYNNQTGMEGADETAWHFLQWGPWMLQGYPSDKWVNVVGEYVPVGDPTPQPGPQPGLQGDPKAIALAAIAPVVDAYAAELSRHPRSINARAHLIGAQAAGTAVEGATFS